MRDITLCHPRLQRIASAWIKACATEGITVAIGETLRTVAEQDALYAQGRTKPGNIVTNAKGSSYSSCLLYTSTESAVRKRGGSRNLPYLNAKPRQIPLLFTHA